MIKLALEKYYSCCPSSNAILSNKLNLPLLGIDHLAIRSLNQKYYESNNFKEKYEIVNFKKIDIEYNFPNYEVNANWYKQFDTTTYNTPRIFTSWYVGNYKNISPDNKYIILEDENLTYNQYLDIYNQNQYIAWTHLFRNDINHIAIAVSDIEKVTETMLKNKFNFNTEGGIYKVSNDKNLIQTSLMADMIEFSFLDKKEKIPYVFVEFTERKNNRDGFEQDNANKIFSSTTKN